jgi:hypothetical protein
MGSTLPDDQPVKGGWTPITINGLTCYQRDLGKLEVQAVAWRRANGTNWADEKTKKMRRLGVCEARRGSTVLVPTKEAWADMTRDHAGAYKFGLYSPPDSTMAYVRLPGDVNPNDCWMFYSTRPGTSSSCEIGFNLNAPDCRIVGFAFRGVANGVRIGLAADRAIVQNCLFDCARTPIVFNGSDSNDEQVEDVVIQDNYFKNSDVIDLGEHTDPILGWLNVKIGYARASTVPPDDYYVLGGTRGNKPFGNMENSAISLRYGLRRTIIRRCRVEGYFNGFAGTAARPSDINNVEIYDCYFWRIADNCWEPEGEIENVRIYRCRSEESNTAGASALMGGPIFCRDLISWRSTNRFLAASRTNTPLDAGTGGAIAWKWGGSTPGRMAEERCTYWSDQMRKSGAGIDGYDRSSGEAGAVWFNHRQILRTTKDITDSDSHIRHLTECVEAGEGQAALMAQIDAALPGRLTGNLTPTVGSILAGKGARRHLTPFARPAFD